MSVLGHRLRAYVRPEGFDPLTAFAWTAVYWANDPGWSNPGDGGTVTTWRDGSGNGYTGTATGSPIYRATHAGLNNKAIVECTVDSVASSNFSSAISQPYSMVIIADDIIGEAVWTRVMSTGAHEVNGRIMKQPDGSLVLNTSGYDYPAINVSDTESVLLSALFSGSSSYAVKNGTASGTVNPGTGTAANITVCNDSGGGAAHTEKVAFAGVFAGDFHTEPNYAAFKSWVASYYGLTIA